jgi:hypothetical protein
MVKLVARYGRVAMSAPTQRARCTASGTRVIALVVILDFSVPGRALLSLADAPCGNIALPD